MRFFTVYIIATCYARQSGKTSFPREPEACDRENNPAPLVSPCGKPGYSLLYTLSRKGQKKI
jgi:hypothetical protein